MTRLLAPYLIGAGIFAALVGGLIYFGVTWERDKTDLNNARDHIETRERIDNATTPVDGCAWIDRLRKACTD